MIQAALKAHYKSLWGVSDKTQFRMPDNEDDQHHFAEYCPILASPVFEGGEALGWIRRFSGDSLDFKVLMHNKRYLDRLITILMTPTEFEKRTGFRQVYTDMFSNHPQIIEDYFSCRIDPDSGQLTVSHHALTKAHGDVLKSKLDAASDLSEKFQIIMTHYFYEDRGDKLNLTFLPYELLLQVMDILDQASKDEAIDFDHECIWALNISYCKLPKQPDFLLRFTALERLSMMNCGLKALADLFGNQHFPELTGVNVVDNDLEELPPSLQKRRKEAKFRLLVSGNKKTL